MTRISPSSQSGSPPASGRPGTGSSPERSSRVFGIAPRRIAARVLLLAPAWWVISEGRLEALPLGAVAVAAAAALSLALLPRTRYTPRPLLLLPFLVYFLFHAWRAGLIVARSALQPLSALNPCLVKLRVHLPEGGPRWLLAAVLGLMPGTLCVALEDDVMTLHCLNGDAGIEDEIRAMEKRIVRLLGLTGHE